MTNYLNDTRELVAGASPALVLHGHQGSIRILLNRIGNAPDPPAVAHQRNSVMDDRTSTIVSLARVNVLMTRGSLNGQVVVRPHAVDEQRRLPRTVCEMLQRGQSQPRVLLVDERHSYTTVVKVTPSGSDFAAGGVTV